VSHTPGPVSITAICENSGKGANTINPFFSWPFYGFARAQITQATFTAQVIKIKDYKFMVQLS
jgi:hypothetical protein